MEQGQRERELFLAALSRPTARERGEYLAGACGGDAALRARVDALLAGHFADTDETLQTGPSPAGPGGTLVPPPGLEKPGDRIGRYKLLQQIGEGGCGVVYMAEQEEPVRRRVALKVIRLGMDTKNVVARFEAERQALALMDHPNIAKVLDGGSCETGRPFFVMELVRGIKITEYCDQNQLATGDRLRLFTQVCQAIQHAHQKGVIHRDIKPSNILVTLHDGVPVPKVIDFGIAKAIEQRLTDKTLFTEFQSFIGTPAYTSPEQAEMSGLDVDTRSDIYGLGVLLYELLTGQTPFCAKELSEAGFDEMRRTIREVEPPRPSNRVATMLRGDMATAALHRQVEPPRLVRLLRGDLDWIVMKCIEKDRTRRYATASDLASDVGRYLNAEPVTARPPSAAYKILKFAKRNKIMVAAAALVAAALVLGAVISGWQAVRATRAELEQISLRKIAEQAQKKEALARQRAQADRLAALRRSYDSDMNLAQQALSANNHGRAIDLLDQQRPRPGAPDPRQWEWRYLWNQSQSEAAFSLPSQPHPVTSLAISANGRFLLDGDNRGGVKLWDLLRRAEVAILRESESGPPGPAAFSPAGDRAAVVLNRRPATPGQTGPGGGPPESSVAVWSLDSPKILAEIPTRQQVEALAFAPDGKALLVLTSDRGSEHVVRRWDFEKAAFATIAHIPRSEGFDRRVSLFSPDRRLLALAESGRLRLWDIEAAAQRSELAVFEQGIGAVAFSPKGDMVAVSPFLTETETAIKIFSAANGSKVAELSGHVSWVPDLVFTSDGKRLVSSGADQTVRVWDLAESRQIASLRGHLSEVDCVAVTPDGQTILSASKDGALLGWDAERLFPKKPYELLPIPVSQVEFSANGMASVNWDGSVSLWDQASLREKERLAALGTNAERILFSPDGARLFASLRGGTISVLNLASRTVVTNLESGSERRFRGSRPGGRGGFGGSGLVGFLDRGATLVSAVGRRNLQLWDTATWQMRTNWTLAESAPFGGETVVGPNGAGLYMASMNGIDIVNALSGASEATLKFGQTWGASGLAFSPDGRMLAAASRDGTITFWDANSRAVLGALRGHLLGVYGLAFSPDGERLASTSVGGEAVKLWDVETRQELATLAGEGSVFHQARFSPDGALLIAVNSQGKAHVWRAPSLAEIAKIEARR